MQTPEAGADSTSTVPLQTSVPVQPTGSAQQVPVQPQVRPAPPAAADSPARIGGANKPPPVSCVQAQTVPQVQHVYPAQVQYVEENSGVYTNGNM